MIKKICPICKNENYSTIIKNCSENISLTNHSYSYNFCKKCFVISQYPIPTDKNLNKHYEFIESLNLKKLNSKKGLNIYFKIKDSYKKEISKTFF